MKQTVFCFALLLATGLFAQQQGPAPTTSPPYQTPPTFPEGRQAPGQMPPDTHAPPPQAMSSQRVEGQIVNQLKAEPSLAGTNVDARVDDNSVVLTAGVNTKTQHDMAIRIAESNAGERKVVDKIKVNP
jgi:hypothetical protein